MNERLGEATPSGLRELEEAAIHDKQGTGGWCATSYPTKG
jgi:hypothetical protein